MNKEITEALQLAAGIIEYCLGDAWERECTENERNRFFEIYYKFFPSKQDTQREYAPIRRTIPCPECGKMFYSKPDMKRHLKDKDHTQKEEEDREDDGNWIHDPDMEDQ